MAVRMMSFYGGKMQEKPFEYLEIGQKLELRKRKNIH